MPTSSWIFCETFGITIELGSRGGGGILASIPVARSKQGSILHDHGLCVAKPFQWYAVCGHYKQLATQTHRTSIPVVKRWPYPQGL
jgi:hypothetical protein